MKIRKAEATSKALYTGTHPLFGFVKTRGALNGTRGYWMVAIEWLGEGKGEPNYEAIAPKGLHFDNGDILHTLLATTQAELLERLDESTLLECTPECGGE